MFRLISQNGYFDVPYSDHTTVSVKKELVAKKSAKSEEEDKWDELEECVPRWAIYAQTTSGRGMLMAMYDEEKRALQVMDEIHDEYYASSPNRNSYYRFSKH